MSIAKDIREFFTELFKPNLVEYLETDNLRIREDFEHRLQDKDIIIAELRAERTMLQVKITTYETTLMPLASRAGAQIVAANLPKPVRPSFNSKEWIDMLPKSKWEVIQEEHEKKLAEDEAAEKAAAAQGTV